VSEAEAPSGPLRGIRVVEMAGIGPGPFCAMLLADLGADVVRVDRIDSRDRGVDFPPRFDLLNRNKRSVALDLKSEEGRAAALRLVARAEILIEGFRPGVMERLGLGPEACHAVNPRLVFGRMTGWGQEGPLAGAAGHDLNYIALAGALDAIGRPGERPAIPLNLVGDFGGGALYLALGVLAALIEARLSGQGQVVDASIVDGTASLMTMLLAMRQMGAWPGGRGENLLDGGAPFYDCYETRDGRHITVAALESRFYAELLDRLGLNDASLPHQHDRGGWSALRGRLAEIFRTRTRDEWCRILEGTDACFAPVLGLDECAAHPHNLAREVFVTVEGVVNPAPAPRFSRTPGRLGRPPPAPGADTLAALADWGFSPADLAALREAGAIA
jgi:alpha-methylacyl-CoA racemase